LLICNLFCNAEDRVNRQVRNVNIILCAYLTTITVAQRVALMVAALLYLLPSLAWSQTISAAELRHIADLIYQRECGGEPEKLTSWNRGEDFASLGIGHFIWYPANEPQRFSESFPALIRFIQQRGVLTMPSWLMTAPANPWSNRQAFLAAQNSPRMVQLRQWLDASRSEQILFIQARLDAALPRILAGLNAADTRHVQQQYSRMSNAPMGYFALMDYVNFKGEGINPQERYQGCGWGLLQVLLHMSGTDAASAVTAFSDSAKQQLQQRVRLAPRERHEERWLAGWFKRLDSYNDRM